MNVFTWSPPPSTRALKLSLIHIDSPFSSMARLKVISIVLVALDKVLIRANSFFPNNTMETLSILLDHALHLGLIREKSMGYGCRAFLEGSLDEAKMKSMIQEVSLIHIDSPFSSMARLKVISIVLVALDKVLIRANSFFPNNTMETLSILLDHALHLGLIREKSMGYGCRAFLEGSLDEAKMKSMIQEVSLIHIDSPFSSMARLKVISIVLVALDKVLIRANSFFPNNTMETLSILLDHALHLGLIREKSMGYGCRAFLEGSLDEAKMKSMIQEVSLIHISIALKVFTEWDQDLHQSTKV
ncbi:hypothetical protein CRG98_038879 [Punica granatum]|uniref:Uncharacterized protein n=1 Tax=Punica granatum TaxID=22663 RepID=A0A2I0I9T7_PUNGR|nr:hypothetical protein CRG98_038879 [Punica granatum]